MQQPVEMIEALLSASACILFFLFQKYETFRNWKLLKVLSSAMGLSAVVRLSEAFDPPHHGSLRSLVVIMAGFVLAILLLIRSKRTAK